MNDNENDKPGAEIWNRDTSPLQLLARIDQKTTDMDGWLGKLDKRLVQLEAKLDKFIEMHNRTCPAKVHAAFFKIIACALGLLGAGIVGLALKAIAG